MSYGNITYSVTSANGTDITSDITFYDYVEADNAFALYEDYFGSYTPMDATYNLCIYQIEFQNDSSISKWKIMATNYDDGIRW